MKPEEYENDYERYTRLLSYCTYLYEEEKDRSTLLNNTSKIYMAAQIFVLTIIGAKIIGAELIYVFYNSLISFSAQSPLIGSIIGIILISSFVFFMSSFVFAVLVNKMWEKERPNDPEKILSSIGEYSTENILISKITADYAVATNRNHKINDSKAVLLKYSLSFFMASIFCLLAGLICSMIYIN